MTLLSIFCYNYLKLSTSKTVVLKLFCHESHNLCLKFESNKT